MKIAIDVRCLMEEQFSGVGQYALQLTRAMLQVAPEHEYHGFYNSWSPISLPSLGEHIQLHMFRYPNKFFNLSQWAVAWPKWDRLLPQMDVFFVPSLRLVPLSQGVPMVSVVHDLSFEHFPELFNSRRRVWHSMMRPKRLAENSDAIIAVSEHTKQDVVNLYGVAEKRVQVVYSGVATTGPVSLSPPPGARRKPSVQRAGGPQLATRLVGLPEKFILYLGTLEPRKNVDSLVRAFDAIADSVEQDLVIAGGAGWSTGELEKAIREATHNKRIHLLGFVKEEDKSALYEAADVFVYPSLYEGFGFPPLEALMAGTPVITSFNSALPEVVGEYVTLIDPYDTAELALVLKELLHDLPVVSEETKAAISQKYSWERAAKETLGVLTAVA